MLEFLTPKKSQFFKAKWVSSEDEAKNGYFKFQKIKETNRKTANGNVTIKSGEEIWESKTTLPIQADDTCYFGGFKYFVIDVSIEVDDNNDGTAFLFMKENGNKKKVIALQKVI